MGHRERNAEAVADYLEVWHLMERASLVPETPMDRKEKGSSRAPMGDEAHDLAEANREASRVLEPILGELARRPVRYGGVLLSDLLLEAREYPEAVSRHRDIRTRGYPGHEGRRARAFFAMCRLTADALAARHDGPGGPYELRVITSKDRARRVAEQQEDPRRYRPDVRRYTAHDAYRSIVADVERLQREGYSREAAKATKAEELGCSVGRVEDAITFVNRERGAQEEGVAS